MEYLVESHLGGYYITSLDEKIITESCEECGDSDWIILSYEEGKLFEALKKYLSSFNYTKKRIEEDQKYGITKEEIKEDIIYNSDIDMGIIYSLFEDNYITEKEKIQLINILEKTKQNEFSLVESSYPKSVKTLIRKR